MKKILSMILILSFMISMFTCVNASSDNSSKISKPEMLVPVIDNKNLELKLVKTYTTKEKDKDGIEWTDTVYRYQVTRINNETNTQNKNDGAQSSNANVTAELPPIDARIESVVGTDSNRTYIRYYGRCYSEYPVTANMSMALLSWVGDVINKWIVEDSQPTYTNTGTALATPIYVYRYPTLGMWMSRNQFTLSAPDYKPTSGTAYSGQLYVEPY